MVTPTKPLAKTPAARPVVEADRLTEAIELLFFAYRDFISDPDEILARYDFGRAHHRVVHFVGRNPGITVAELLNILRITKQSLARVLKQLIERGFVEQETGKQDRRQRLLYLTAQGRELEQRLAAPQRARVAAALEKAGPGAGEAWRTVLLELVNEEDRAEVERRIAKAAAEQR
ncbi:MarR family transcriptional regulator [Parvibaculum sp.]|jgi:DNA-binding MarR family transcriptional regulator|uniref:MarR family winged helix-turn-helix transcriptional regulator n=1 Tax=Parvibaculum sp. TaxID=2024848 RepID=UPI000C4EF527|nr:MarR family transcriptional regulator [Parvibaculum sp.]HAC56854.1 MarR family transcriptional regulator [Rhodobiaceae bacterium]MAU59805.1 MarR family transcriptional regulator [Parvibaculum sp.]MBO6667690.1 MarR family transcriptional regulator [Parvibaculum sp.]MBO6692897.1 MarR family transcriptional regulator [Parvibaculum sp.]MBO6715225.1 MarR family transcriptional regulator [Parvibaculum sp.]|tara:strand:+ start:2856 stop:3380 length:525 start_codon:yes stop_codon:yes gene_type:complete